MTRNCSVNSGSSRSSWCVVIASSSPPGPQANVVRSARSGTSRVDVVEVEDAVLVVVPRDQPDDAGGLERRRSSRKIESGSLGATCSTVMSYAAERARRSTPLSVDGKRLRSMPITGVMPEPAVTKRSLAGSAFRVVEATGSTNSPAACSRWSSVPGRVCAHEVGLT